MALFFNFVAILAVALLMVSGMEGAKSISKSPPPKKMPPPKRMPSPPPVKTGMLCVATGYGDYFNVAANFISAKQITSVGVVANLSYHAAALKYAKSVPGATGFSLSADGIVKTYKGSGRIQAKTYQNVVESCLSI